MGAPFFLFSGRDDSAFLKFKERTKGGVNAWIHLMHRPSLQIVAGQINPQAIGLGRTKANTLGAGFGEMDMLSKLQGVDVSDWDVDNLTPAQVAAGMDVGGVSRAGYMKGITGYGTGAGAYETFYEMADVPNTFDIIMDVSQNREVKGKLLSESELST